MDYLVKIHDGAKESTESITADVVEFDSPWVRFYRNEQPLRKLLVKAFQESNIKSVEEIDGNVS